MLNCILLPMLKNYINGRCRVSNTVANGNEDIARFQCFNSQVH
uniref:Uncharacterized protein n=1 Tax=Arundo donax TaxID=35708 RepID=A0A0A9BI38_ARUDO